MSWVHHADFWESLETVFWHFLNRSILAAEWVVEVLGFVTIKSFFVVVVWTLLHVEFELFDFGTRITWSSIVELAKFRNVQSVHMLMLEWEIIHAQVLHKLYRQHCLMVTRTLRLQCELSLVILRRRTFYTPMLDRRLAASLLRRFNLGRLRVSLALRHHPGVRLPNRIRSFQLKPRLVAHAIHRVILQLALRPRNELKVVLRTILRCFNLELCFKNILL